MFYCYFTTGCKLISKLKTTCVTTDGHTVLKKYTHCVVLSVTIKLYKHHTHVGMDTVTLSKCVLSLSHIRAKQSPLNHCVLYIVSQFWLIKDLSHNPFGQSPCLIYDLFIAVPHSDHLIVCEKQTCKILSYAWKVSYKSCHWLYSCTVTANSEIRLRFAFRRMR